MGTAVLTRSKKPRASFAFHRNASFASLLVGYAGYYLCRSNLSVAMPAMESALHVSKTSLGWVLSLGTLMYALGKVTTGSLADARGGRFAFFVGLFASVAASLVLGLVAGHTPHILAVVGACWCVNLFFQSMG